MFALSVTQRTNLAMTPKMRNPDLRAKFSAVAETCAAEFDMARLVKSYVRIYVQARQRFEGDTLAR